MLGSRINHDSIHFFQRKASHGKRGNPEKCCWWSARLQPPGHAGEVVVVVCAKDRPQPECLLPKDLTGFVWRKAVMACVWGPSCPMNVMKWSEGRPSSLDRPLPPFPHKFRRTSVKLRPASVADDWKRFHADLGQVRRPPPIPRTLAHLQAQVGGRWPRSGRERGAGGGRGGLHPSSRTARSRAEGWWWMLGGGSGGWRCMRAFSRLGGAVAALAAIAKPRCEGDAGIFMTATA